MVPCDIVSRQTEIYEKVHILKGEISRRHFIRSLHGLWALNVQSENEGESDASPSFDALLLVTIKCITL